MVHPSKEMKKKIVEAYLSGNSITHLTHIFKVHRNSIRKWIKVFKFDPEFTRRTSPGSGRLSVFDKKISKRLLSIISKPASCFGFETDFWTTARIQRVCKETLKLKVSRMAIHRVLVKFEQSYKKPQKRYVTGQPLGHKEWFFVSEQ